MMIALLLTIVCLPVCFQVCLQQLPPTLNVPPNLSLGEPTLTDGLGLQTVNFTLHCQSSPAPPLPLPPLLPLLPLLLLLLQALEAWP